MHLAGKVQQSTLKVPQHPGQPYCDPLRLFESTPLYPLNPPGCLHLPTKPVSRLELSNCGWPALAGCLPWQWWPSPPSKPGLFGAATGPSESSYVTGTERERLQLHLGGPCQASPCGNVEVEAIPDWSNTQHPTNIGDDSDELHHHNTTPRHGPPVQHCFCWPEITQHQRGTGRAARESTMVSMSRPRASTLT